MGWILIFGKVFFSQSHPAILTWDRLSKSIGVWAPFKCQVIMQQPPINCATCYSTVSQALLDVFCFTGFSPLGAPEEGWDTRSFVVTGWDTRSHPWLPTHPPVCQWPPLFYCSTFHKTAHSSVPWLTTKEAVSTHFNILGYTLLAFTLCFWF